MISACEVIDFFGKDNLIYTSSEKLSEINLPQKSKEFILTTGFPYIVDNFRFSMDFEAIAEDIEIGKSTQKIGKMYTIGYISASQVIGRLIHLSEIGLDRNSSLSDIERRVRVLGIDEYYLFHVEATQSERICINIDNQGEIICINPKDLSISFLNSNIQKMILSLIAYKKYFLLEDDFTKGMKQFKEEMRIIDPKALDNQGNVWVGIIERLISDNEGY